MAQNELNCVEFDYASFLGASCDKEWTFLEAVNVSVSNFRNVGMGNKDVVDISPQERLWKAALNALSTGYSDESNLIALCSIAKSENIAVFKLIMPYPLNSAQIQSITQSSGAEICVLENDIQDEFLINVH
ncbi:transporter [Vibrio sp. S4M6]|uniref:transporter n=1 Tax=Vibrio sinus TaxID=2946865 RepID=UPI002029FC3D|nr:transporter [Vibrio sinus]MCL9782008.1 transporter [Vibrio sinus]